MRGRFGILKYLACLYLAVGFTCFRPSADGSNDWESKSAKASRKVPILVSWSGECAIALREKAPRFEFIKSAEKLKGLWSAWRPKEAVPQVNFDQAILLVAANGDPNSMSIEGLLNADGDVRFGIIQTAVGYTGATTFRYHIALISRDGVKSIHGQRLGD
jgi:hypothetical protein